MRTGKLRSRLVLERAARSADSFGQLVETWSTVATYWAEWLTPKALERVVGEQQGEDVTHGIRLRGRLDVRSTDRFRAGSRVLQIDQVVNPDNRGIELICVCREAL